MSTIPVQTSRPGGVSEVLRLAWPVVVSMISFTLLAAVDTYFAGRIGTAEQGAIGFCGTFLWAIWCFFVGTIDIVQTFVAQATGAGDERENGRWGSAGLRLAWIFGILLLPMAWAGEWLFTTVGVAAEMIPAADRYLQLRMLGTFFVLAAHVGDSFYRGIGDTVTPMVIGVAINVINAILDAVLVLGVPALGVPAFGVDGLAWASNFANFSQFAIYLWVWRRRALRGGSIPRFRTRAPWSDLKQLLRVGAPAGMHWFLDVSAWTFFTLAVARLDAVEAAANVIGLSIIRLSFMPGIGVSKAAQTLVGQYLGAGEREHAVRSGWTSTWITAVYMGVAGLLFWLGAPWLVGLFTDDPVVIEVGARLMVWAALFQLGDGVQFVLSAALRGAGDTAFVMWASLIGAWVIFVPLTVALMTWGGFGAEGGWIAVNVWVLSLAAVLVHRYHRGAWLDRAPVAEGA